MRVYVLASGSNGNALLVESRGTRILVEAGLGPRLLEARLAELGVDLGALALGGILASHHHGDHFGHAARLATAFDAPLWLHRGISPPAIDHRRYEVGAEIRIGALAITTVLVPHDAPQVAFRIDDGVSALGIATDVGRVTSSLVALLSGCDVALVEANHCTELLAFSDYPDVVKRRLGGGLGHLSNAQTAELAARLVGSRLSRLYLGHLSESNNTPARALEAVASRARRIDVAVVPNHAPVALDVRAGRPYQLGLPF